MKRVAVQKATDHLDLADDTIDEMAKAIDFKTYERAWMHFFSEVSRFYSKIEKGTKGCNVSEYWFGVKKYERKRDNLLSYIHHARDCEEHTIDHTAAISADGLTGQTEDGKSFNISFDFMIDDKGRQHYRNVKAKGPDGEDLPFALANPKLVLLRVVDKRYGHKFEPPTMHRTRPIVDTSPLGVARLAMIYLKEFLAEAENLPQRF